MKQKMTCSQHPFFEWSPKASLPVTVLFIAIGVYAVGCSEIDCTYDAFSSPNASLIVPSP